MDLNVWQVTATQNPEARSRRSSFLQEEAVILILRYRKASIYSSIKAGTKSSAEPQLCCIQARHATALVRGENKRQLFAAVLRQYQYYTYISPFSYCYTENRSTAIEYSRIEMIVRYRYILTRLYINISRATTKESAYVRRTKIHHVPLPTTSTIIQIAMENRTIDSSGRTRPVIVRAVSSQEQRLRGYRIGLPQDTEALKPCPQTSRAMALHVHMKVKARERGSRGWKIEMDHEENKGSRIEKERKNE
ncbi:hypothetical protein M0804_009552 [Polistes exclamans]|nr:hypothetical protein M0804_009552 [Polistes exclamans]